MSTWARSIKNALQNVPRNAARHRGATLVLIIALSFVSYLFFSRLVVTAVEVRGSSMSPTLVSGDMVILNRFAAITRVPERGQLVVLKDPETHELVVKRIIGLPEETVHVLFDHAYVNGKLLDEPYLYHARKLAKGALGKGVTLPKGSFFVLGDNRNNSIDSRSFGPVPRENIVGVINL